MALGNAEGCRSCSMAGHSAPCRASRGRTLPAAFQSAVCGSMNRADAPSPGATQLQTPAWQGVQAGGWKLRAGSSACQSRHAISRSHSSRPSKDSSQSRVISRRCPKSKSRACSSSRRPGVSRSPCRATRWRAHHSASPGTASWSCQHQPPQRLPWSSCQRLLEWQPSPSPHASDR